MQKEFLRKVRRVPDKIWKLKHIFRQSSEMKKGWINPTFFSLSTLPWVSGPHSEFQLNWPLCIVSGKSHMMGQHTTTLKRPFLFIFRLGLTTSRTRQRAGFILTQHHQKINILSVRISIISRTLSDLGNRSERMANRGQIFGKLKANSGPIRRKFPGIWTVLPFSQ